MNNDFNYMVEKGKLRADCDLCGEEATVFSLSKLDFLSYKLCQNCYDRRKKTPKYEKVKEDKKTWGEIEKEAMEEMERSNKRLEELIKSSEFGKLLKEICESTSERRKEYMEQLYKDFERIKSREKLYGKYITNKILENIFNETKAK